MIKIPVELFKRFWTIVCLSLLVFMAVLPAARAQETTGAVEGTVKDKTGASIAGATVKEAATNSLASKQSRRISRDTIASTTCLPAPIEFRSAHLDLRS